MSLIRYIKQYEYNWLCYCKLCKLLRFLKIKKWEDPSSLRHGLPIFTRRVWNQNIREASSAKLQATSLKHNLKLQAPSNKLQAPSEDRYKPQASSDKQQASWDLNPSLTSAKILVPGNNLQEPWLGFLASIKVFFGCWIWNEIWCGLKRILLWDVSFNSTVKKCPKVLYPNRSGVPRTLVFSSLVHDILGVILLSSCHNFVSGFIKTMNLTDA